MKSFRLIITLAIIAVFSSPLFAGWSEPVRLTYRGNEMMPQVVARHDTVHVVWEYDVNEAQICYIRSTDNGITWGNIINLTQSGHRGYYPILTVTDSALWVSWLDNNSVSIAITSSTNGGIWGTPLYKYTIDSERWGGLCMAASGDTIFLTYMAWTRDSTGLRPFKFLRSPDGGYTWSNLVTIGHSFYDILGVRLAYGNGYLVLAASLAPGDGGYHILGYTSSDFGQTWSDTIWLSPQIAATAQQPCIAHNSITGQFAVGYMDYRYQQYAFYGDIFIRLSVADPYQWDFETQATDEHMAKYPSISYYDNHIAVVWSDRKYLSTGYDEIFFNSSTDGGLTWVGAERLTFTPSWSFYPWIYGDSNVQHLVWYENDDSAHTRDIYYMKYTRDSSDIIKTDTPIPSSFQISAYPNPFNSTLSISITAEQQGTLNISDILGRFVTELNFPKGASTLKWDATDKDGKVIRSGAYFLKPKGGSYKDIIKVMYLK
jgi:hypothetical protein